MNRFAQAFTHMQVYRLDALDIDVSNDLKEKDKAGVNCEMCRRRLKVWLNNQSKFAVMLPGWL